jgi:hypothetical protein
MMPGKLTTTLAVLFMAASIHAAQAPDALDRGFRNPPSEARLRCYWWWLEGNVTRESITRDLEGMRAKGYGGAVLADADGASQRGNNPVAPGPMFGSPEWRALFRHALAEADRLGLEITLNIQSGWNVGGPFVKPEESAKLVTWSQAQVKGPARFDQILPQPKTKEGFYRDIVVMAYPLHHGAGPARRPIKDLPIKGAFKEAGFSNPVTTPLLTDLPPEPGEEDTQSRQVQIISIRMDAEGRLQWDVPAGEWEILRFGYTSSGAKVSTSSGNWQGLVIDYLDHTALESYWMKSVDPLLADAKPYLGKTLAYAFTDSWEVGGVNWSPRFGEEFRKRRHYDLTPYLPVLAGRIVDDRTTSIRFLNDLRKTVGDLVADEHYAAFAGLARRYGLGIHPEAGGPHGAPVDALKCLGRTTFPQMEFWAKSPIHRVNDEDRFFVKEAAAAAHIYGKNLVAAEGFTSIGNHWNESLWGNLKPTFDRAMCEGLNRLVWHTFTSSPAATGIPGQEYFAGTHLNPKVTWWPQADAFLIYLNRGQFLMQQGKFVADALYYYGDHVPNFVRLKADDPAKVLPGFDYDVVNEEVLLGRLHVENGWLTLPDGMRYRVLVMPDLPMISLPALRKVRELVEAGATMLGPKPSQTTGLEGAPLADKEVQRLASELWGPCDATHVRERRYGKGRVVCAGTARDLLLADHVPPDFAFEAAAPGSIDYIHRSTGGAEIYFVSNQSERAVKFPAIFRVQGKTPELWDAVSGEIRTPAQFEPTPDGRTRLTLDLAPYGSAYVIFRQPVQPHVLSVQRDGKADVQARVWLTRQGQFAVESESAGAYELKLSSGKTIHAMAPGLDSPLTIAGPWHVLFSSPAATPPEQDFDTLRSWTLFDNPVIKYFAGSATYSTRVNIPASMLSPGKRIWLDLGEVGEIAEVWLNGKALGTHWMPPFRVDVTETAKAGRNELQVRVTNLWVNRLVGDSLLPPEQRTTRTNITQLPEDKPLMPSGLMGPVTLRTYALVTAHSD